MVHFLSALLLAFCCMVGVNAQKVLPRDSYCKISKNHVLCLFTPGVLGPKCGNVFNATLTQVDKDAIVAKHNEIRSRVARGKENRTAGGSLPTAADMRKMVWDEELATVVQTFLNQCNDDADPVAPETNAVPRFKFNFMGGLKTKSNITPWNSTAKTSWTSFIQEWYEGRQFLSKDNIWMYPIQRMSVADVDSFKGNINFAQVLWAKSYAVGCGVLETPAWSSTDPGTHDTVFMCFYGEAGSIRGAKIYTKGTLGSQCPKGTKLEKNGSGLCA